MKKNIFYLFFLCFCCATSGFAQTFIPDKNFAYVIREQCSSCITLTDTLTDEASSFIYLDVHNRQIKSLEGLEAFVNVTNLICYDNLLTSLPALPKGLIYLECYSNLLTYLPTLPNSLIDLGCDGNKLTNLPFLPKGLIYLACSKNLLTKLPPLPNNLMNLECSMNNLVDLPNLPPSLVFLYCDNNQLTTLPALPDALTLLNCNDNNLTFLPALGQKLIKLDGQNNPNLSCINGLLPNTIFSLDVSNTNVKCLPNKPSNIAQYILPICDATNTNGCFFVTSTTENEPIERINIYPNPIENLLHIETPITISNITMTNILG
ncbi:MAG: hypothetical protein RLZZ292_1385 [Bacteroidota bacterium]|jgi:hypothetical protein